MNYSELPIIKETQVAVVGGGLAGCAAALASARNGAKTLLIESGGILGEAATAGLVAPISSISSKSGKQKFDGILWETIDKVKAYSKKICHATQQEHLSLHVYKYVLLEMLNNAGVDLFFHVFLSDAVSKANGEIDYLVVSTKDGLKRIKANIFIDTTGDGDVMGKSMADTIIGSEPGVLRELEDEKGELQTALPFEVKKDDYVGKMQPVSLMMLFGGVDVKTGLKYMNKKLTYDERFKKWRYDDLPIMPEPFQYVVAPGKEAAFENLRALMNRPDVDTIVNACDAGREGELIFRLAYEMAGYTKPTQRLWISSMEDSVIRDGFRNFRPGGEYDSLYHSALCRQKADWLVGINATRLFSVLYHRTLNVGRVQTPTLAMLVERDGKIMLFKKEKYHHVRLNVNGIEAVSEKFTDLAQAEKAADICKNAPITCTAVVTEQKKEPPPKLYDLTTLQREVNRIFGYTAKQTLDYAQSLYEKKLLTYPRTDSRYLTSDMAETASCVIHLAAKVPPFDGCGNFYPLLEVLVKDSAVTDHHAIIPTMEIKPEDIKALPVGERNLLLLVCCKLLCAAASPYEYEAVTATFDCSGHTFTAKGKRVLAEGWREIDRIFRASLKEKPENEDNGVLPDFVEGQVFENAAVTVTEHFTSPPKPYTEDTLLSAMENAGKEDIPDEAERKGLGTPATRAAIIEKLVSAGFVERKGKNLIPTKAGVNLVSVLPEPLTSPMLTADWEQKLTEIAKGSADPAVFMDGICAMVKDTVSTYSHISEEGQKLFAPDKEVIGNCPRCGKPVYEGKSNFACSDRSCSFVLWKNDRFWTSRKKELTRKMAADLLKKGRTNVKGMWSEKKGSTYDATVILDDTGEKFIHFKLEFPKRKEIANGRK